MQASVLIFTLFLTAIGVKGDKPDEAMKKHHEIDKICQKESHVTDEELMEMIKGNYGDDIDKLKEHALCVCKQYGYINDDGELLEDKMKKYLYDLDKKEEADELLSKCIVHKDTPLETAWAFSKCGIPIFFPKGSE